MAALTAACSTADRGLTDEAVSRGFAPVELRGGEFRIRAYYHPGHTADDALHVYLEGDGSPWISRTTVAQDPTTRNPLMLKLMALDAGPTLYLGRPCYDGHAADPECGPLLWTHERYSPAVVLAMADGLQRFLRAHSFPRLLFFGHSGGGTLAVLLAERFAATASVATIGANLDTDNWTKHHGYSALTGSANPAASKSGTFDEYHYFGSGDRQTPAALFRPAILRRPHARLIEIPNFDHFCCWETIWPEIVRQAAQRTSAALSTTGTQESRKAP